MSQRKEVSQSKIIKAGRQTYQTKEFDLFINKSNYQFCVEIKTHYLLLSSQKCSAEGGIMGLLQHYNKHQQPFFPHLQNMSRLFLI